MSVNQRETVSEETLRQVLIDLTTHYFGEDVSFIGHKIVIESDNGEPNWDASCGNVDTYVLSAFRSAKRNALAKYNLDHPHP